MILNKYLKQRRKYSVLCAISNKKIINTKIVLGSVDKEIFFDFIKELKEEATNIFYWIMLEYIIRR